MYIVSEDWIHENSVAWRALLTEVIQEPLAHHHLPHASGRTLPAYTFVAASSKPLFFSTPTLVHMAFQLLDTSILMADLPYE